MKLHLLNQRAFIAMPFLRSIKRVSFFSTSSQLNKKWESGAGVSMVQGASRGIGLEFVSNQTTPPPLSISFSFFILLVIHFSLLFISPFLHVI